MSAGSIVTSSVQRAGLLFNVPILSSRRSQSTDRRADTLTSEYVALSKEIAKDWIALTVRYQKQAAATEASFEAFNAAVAKLPSHWSDSRFPHRQRTRVYRQLNSIVCWFLQIAEDRNGPLTPTLRQSSFAHVLREEQNKIEHDDDYRKSAIGPYGAFALSDSKEEFDYAVCRAEELDKCVASMCDFLFGEEKRLDRKEVTPSHAQQTAQQTRERLHALDRSIADVSSTISHDLAEIEKAMSQWETLQWCIDGLTTEIDRTTKEIAAKIERVQEIECSFAALRPFKGAGCAEQKWSTCLQEMKSWDIAIIEQVTAHRIRATHLSAALARPDLTRSVTLAPIIERRRSI